ncbi:MAG: hypothetical protein MJB14_19710 [Spirochaetes bacterium]|nr:hypothetical protein [Spirochaetota bacterium]
MKKLFLVFFTVFLLVSAIADNPFIYLIYHKDIMINHFILEGKNIPTTITETNFRGELEPYPQIDDDQIYQRLQIAYQAYDNKEYHQAAQILNQLYKKDKSNPFLLNQYARALYWSNSKKSFRIYKKLIQLLDHPVHKKGNYFYIDTSKYQDLPQQIHHPEIATEMTDLYNQLNKKFKTQYNTIDVWFIEAYWKIGTLYLDRKDYLSGAYYITKALFLLNNNPKLAEQAFGYLAESYYFLDKPALSLYCAEITKQINPENKYVEYFIDQIAKQKDKKMQKQHSKELENIVKDLYNLVASGPDRNSQCYAIIQKAYELIKSKRIILKLIKDQESGILSGAELLISSESQIPVIQVSDKLLSIYADCPSIVYSILIHEFQHTLDYMKDPQYFLSIRNNELEEFLYEMDAAYIEALFIRDYLQPIYELSPFENFLIMSLENDNLAQFSNFFKQTDMNLVYRLYGLRKDQEKSYTDDLAELIRTGKELIKNYEYQHDKEDWERYTDIVSLYSFNQYVPQIFYDTLVGKAGNQESPDELNQKEHSPELYDIYLKISELMKPHLEEFETYYQENLDKFESYYH